MIEITLTDITTTDTLEAPEVPITTTPLEGAVDVKRLDNGLRTYFTNNKRSWGHTWSYMDRSEFDTLKGFYDRQWTTFSYPLLTISEINVTNVPVRMYLEAENIIDDCATVSSVTVSWREK